MNKIIELAEENILHTYNKPGPDWYLDPLKTETVIKSFISFFISLLGCFSIAAINDRIKKKRRS